jgi:hypothetical protein
MTNTELAGTGVGQLNGNPRPIIKPRRIPRRLKIYGYNLITLGIFFGAWYGIQSSTTSSYFPTIGGVERAAIGLITKGDIQGFSLVQHAWASSVRVFAGFGLALVMGVTLGLLASSRPLPGFPCRWSCSGALRGMFSLFG